MDGWVGEWVGGFLVIEMADNLTLFCPAEHVHYETNPLRSANRTMLFYSQ